MDVLALTGELGPANAREVSEALARITTQLRPTITVDCSEVTELHPAVASVIIRHRRQAQRQGGDLYVVGPADRAAAHVLDQVGILALLPAR